MWGTKRTASSGLALLLASCASLAFVRPAAAEEQTAEKMQARTLLQRGNVRFEHGDFRGALADYQAAYALYPAPKLLVNIATAEREGGDLVAAASDFRRYLDEMDELAEEPGLIAR